MRGTVKPIDTPRDKRAYDPVVLWCRASRLPEPELEFIFHPTRKWRFDYSWRPADGEWRRFWQIGTELKLALEIEGGVFETNQSSRGRHSRGAGFREDCLKYAEAALLGWTVLRATPEQITDGTAFGWLTRFFQQRDQDR